MKRVFDKSIERYVLEFNGVEGSINVSVYSGKIGNTYVHQEKRISRRFKKKLKKLGYTRIVNSDKFFKK